MRQFINIFKFEFNTFFKDKMFIGITLFMILAAGIALSFPRISGAFSMGGKADEKQTIAISGLTDTVDIAMFETAMPKNEFVNVTKTVDELTKDVEAETYMSAVVLTGELSYQYIVKNVGMYDNTQKTVDEVLKSVYQEQSLENLGADKDEIIDFMKATVTSEVLQTSSGKDQAKNFFYTYVLMIALYMAILLYGQFVAMSVATEKSSRAMELLITSSKPTYLMFGKIIGTGCAGLLQFALIFGSGYVFYNINADVYTNNSIIQSIFNMPINILLFALLFFVLGFFIYAFLYGALGSMVSRIEQLNTSIMPATFLFLFAFMSVMFSMAGGNINSVFVKVISFIPFTAPMAMFARIAMGTVAVWEILVSTAVLVFSTIGVGYLAARIYRMGVLMYGQPPKIKEIFTMMKEMRD